MGHYVTDTKEGNTSRFGGGLKKKALLDEAVSQVSVWQSASNSCCGTLLPRNCNSVQPAASFEKTNPFRLVRQSSSVGASNNAHFCKMLKAVKRERRLLKPT